MRAEDGALKAIAIRPNTIVRIWKGRKMNPILQVEHPELESGDEFFDILERFEVASWGSSIYRVRQDSTLQHLDDGVEE